MLSANSLASLATKTPSSLGVTHPRLPQSSLSPLLDMASSPPRAERRTLKTLLWSLKAA